MFQDWDLDDLHYLIKVVFAKIMDLLLHFCWIVTKK